MKRLGLPNDASGEAIRPDGLELRPGRVIWQILPRGVVDDLAVQADERDPHVFGNRFDAPAKSSRLVPEKKAADRKAGKRARRLLRLSDELESVSDEAATILKVTRRLRKDGQNFSAPSLQVLLGIHDRMTTFAQEVSALLKSPRPAFDLAAVQAKALELHDLVRTSRQGQLNRIGPEDPTSAIRVLVELDILNAYECVRGYYLNIAETLAGGKGN